MMIDADLNPDLGVPVPRPNGRTAIILELYNSLVGALTDCASLGLVGMRDPFLIGAIV
jgi:hypothetical protein